MLDASHAQLSTYCTAQGRMLATLLLWHDAPDYFLQLPAEIAGERALRRLQKYILRAAVTLTDATPQLRLLGLGGPGASAALAGLVDRAPAEPMDDRARARGHRHPSARAGAVRDRRAGPRTGAAVWNHLAGMARPAGTDGWRWRLIRAGLPVVTAATQEQFVPQMANLEQLGAVSFTKGCYPGQEIVARAQYRGEVKRRLFRLHAPDASTRRRAADIPVRRGRAACGTVRRRGGCTGRRIRSARRGVDRAQPRRATCAWAARMVRRCACAASLLRLLPRRSAGRGRCARCGSSSCSTACSERCGVRGRLLTKRGEPNLWMEVYEGVQDGGLFESALAGRSGVAGPRGACCCRGTAATSSPSRNSACA